MAGRASPTAGWRSSCPALCQPMIRPGRGAVCPAVPHREPARGSVLPNGHRAEARSPGIPCALALFVNPPRGAPETLTRWGWHQAGPSATVTGMNRIMVPQERQC